LGAGSGIDTASLAQNLVDAEKAPRADAINKNITKSESIISGYAAVKYALGNVKAAFDNLKDKSDFRAFNLSNSQPAAFTATASTSAQAGSHSIAITQLATAQRRTGSTPAFTSTDQTLSVTALYFNGDTGNPIPVTNSTPAGVVEAINNAGKGLSAALLNTGNGYKIMVTGQTGTANAFRLDSDVPSQLDFATSLQPASDAALQVDGIDVVSASNTVTDAIPGVTFNLLATNASRVTDANGNTTTTGVPGSLALTVDTSGAKTKLMALVTAYNDANDLLKQVTDPKSTLDTYGGTLVGNSSVRAIREQLRNLVTGDSSTAGGSNGTGPAHSLSALRDIGIEVDKTGNLTTNSVTMDVALNFKLDDMVTLLTGNQENQTSFSTAASGLAGDASKTLTTLMGSSGTLATETANANTRISKYKDDLAALDDRMTRLLARYQKQFSSMDSMIGEIKSTQTGLTSTFAGLMAMYTNK
jgi:flagellar hook-associated protein 2